MATLPRWPLKIVIIDIAWGVILCTGVAGAAFLIARRLLSARDLSPRRLAVAGWVRWLTLLAASAGRV